VVVWETTGAGFEGVLGGWGVAGGSAGCGAVPVPGPVPGSVGDDGAGVGSEADCGGGVGLSMSPGGLLVPLGVGGVVAAPDGGEVPVSLGAGGVLLPLLAPLVVSVDVVGGLEAGAGAGELASTGVDAGGLPFVATEDGGVVTITGGPGVAGAGEALDGAVVGASLTAAAGGLEAAGWSARACATTNSASTMVARTKPRCVR
jgi:hypothetical protein